MSPNVCPYQMLYFFILTIKTERSEYNLKVSIQIRWPRPDAERGGRVYIGQQ